MLKHRNLRVFLFNYLIQVGSFANLQKYDGKLYRDLLNYKKMKDPDSKDTLSEWLQGQLLSKYIRPKKTKSLWKVVEYNALIYSIAINIADEVNTMEHLPIDMLNGFENIDHMKSFEPAYVRFIENRIPRYQGQLPADYPGVMKVEGYKYWGENVTERTDFANDLLAFFKGSVKCQYLTPYIDYRLMRVLAVHGNLNLIGMDNMDLIYDLNELKNKTRMESIAEMLRLDRYHFEPVAYNYGDKALYLKRANNYAVVLDGCESEIIIAKEIYQVLKEQNKLQSIFIQETKNGAVTLKELMVDIEGSVIPVHALYTRNMNGFVYADRNTLNLRLTNIS